MQIPTRLETAYSSINQKRDRLTKFAKYDPDDVRVFIVNCDIYINLLKLIIKKSY